MKRQIAKGLCVLAIAAASPAIAMDTINSRDHSCVALQEKAIENGQVTLKTLFGKLTVYNPLRNCGSRNHQAVSPVWKTSDERYCIVGSYCTPVYSSNDL